MVPGSAILRNRSRTGSSILFEEFSLEHPEWDFRAASDWNPTWDNIAPHNGFDAGVALAHNGSMYRHNTQP